MFFQIFLYENPAATKFSSVNIMHNDRIGGSNGFIHGKIAEVLQM